MFGNKEVPQLDKAFPGLFDEEMQEYREQQFALQMKEFVRRFNTKRAKEQQKSKGETPNG